MYLAEIVYANGQEWDPRFQKCLRMTSALDLGKVPVDQGLLGISTPLGLKERIVS